MLHRVLSARRLLTGGTAGSLVLILAATATAQSLNEGMDVLNKKQYENRDLIKKLFAEGAPLNVNLPMEMEAVDVEAKMVTYPYVLEAGAEKTPGKFDKIFKVVEGDRRNIIKNRAAAPGLDKVFSTRVKEHALEILNLPTAKPVARVNAARTLARLTELGQGDLADTFVEVLHTPLKQEQGRDGVRYYILHGMLDLLSLPPQMPPLFSEDKVTLALLEFLDQPPLATGATATPEEIEGFRILRREAVRALAQTHAPALPGVKDMTKQPAMWLARFAGNDQRIQPPPSLSERFEASLGLARMRPNKKMPNYQADYAAEQIGRFLEAFGNAANGSREEKIAFRRPRPWKIDAAKLMDVLGPMKAEIKDPHVAKVVDVGMRVLGAVLQKQTAQANDLSWFSTNPAPNQMLFKDDPNTTVKLAEPEAPAEK
jgi:hypothetical protein